MPPCEAARAKRCERAMAHMMKARITEIDASHVVMLSQPDRLTAVIEDALGNVSSS
jgi:hypothetical protein